VLAAVEALRSLPATVLVARSALYRSAPIDAAGPDYVNAAALLHTRLSPHELLSQLLAIERRQGRQRSYRNAPRTLDLDLLLHGDLRLQSPRLTLPHPRMHLRAFVLLPLADVWPDAVVPGHGSVRALLAGVDGQSIDRLDDTA
jgi:2-amino-4-hydroxy-6-hydroxymethyldihydropteridine diphosphokinase